MMTSCYCLRIDPPSFLIGSNERIETKFLLDLTYRGAGDFHAFRKQFQLEVTPIVKGTPASSLRWVIQGIVKRRLVFDTPEVTFGEIAPQVSDVVERKIRITSEKPTKALLAKVTPPVCTVDLSVDESRNNGFVASIKPVLDIGKLKKDRRFDCKIDFLIPAGELESEFGGTMPITGQFSSEISIVPANIFLQPAPVGSTAEASLVLKSIAMGPIEIDHIETTDNGLLLKEQEDQENPGHDLVFRVSQKIAFEGDHQGTIRFYLIGPNKDISVVTTEVFYRGEPISTKNPQASAKPQ
jgi:hypothetical protein